MAVISFENIVDEIAGESETRKVPDGYRNLEWHSFSAGDDEFFDKFLGNSNVIRTGEAAGFGRGGDIDRILPGFESPDLDDDFDLNNGYFTLYSSSANNLKFKVFGLMMARGLTRRFLVSARIESSSGSAPSLMTSTRCGST